MFPDLCPNDCIHRTIFSFEKAGIIVSFDITRQIRKGLIKLKFRKEIVFVFGSYHEGNKINLHEISLKI